LIGKFDLSLYENIVQLESYRTFYDLMKITQYNLCAILLIILKIFDALYI